MLISLLLAPACIAASPITWQSGNLQALRGTEYKPGISERSIATFEYANVWTYGDFFVFADYIWPDGAASSYYIEPTLRLSCSRIFGIDCGNALFKDVYLALNPEKPKSGQLRRLIGLSTDMALPGFQFFKISALWRDDPQVADATTYQVTLAWALPFSGFGQAFLFEGFADLAGGEGPLASNQLTAPRLLMDMSPLAGLASGRLWLGCEWQYWHHKFGIRDVTESVPQIQLKWVFL